MKHGRSNGFQRGDDPLAQLRRVRGLGGVAQHVLQRFPLGLLGLERLMLLQRRLILVDPGDDLAFGHRFPFRRQHLHPLAAAFQQRLLPDHQACGVHGVLHTGLVDGDGGDVVAEGLYGIANEIEDGADEEGDHDDLRNPFTRFQPCLIPFLGHGRIRGPPPTS